MFYTPT